MKKTNPVYQTVTLRLTPANKKLLMQLASLRKQSISECVADLVRAAAERLPATVPEETLVPLAEEFEDDAGDEFI